MNAAGSASSTTVVSTPSPEAAHNLAGGASVGSASRSSGIDTGLPSIAACNASAITR